ncbi:MAG: translocation/assembly module TamB domain-containing protein [bacterium]
MAKYFNVRKRWMSLIFLIFIWLIGGSYIVLKSGLVTNLLNRPISEGLSQALNMEVYIRRVEGGFFSGLKLRDLRLADRGLDPKDGYKIRSRSITVRVDPLELLRSRDPVASVRDIVIDRPEIKVSRAKVGWDLPRFVGGGTAPPMALKVRIVGGEIDFVGEDGAPLWTISNIGGIVRVRPEGGVRVNLLATENERNNLSLQADISPGKIDASLKLRNGRLSNLNPFLPQPFSFGEGIYNVSLNVAGGEKLDVSGEVNLVGVKVLSGGNDLMDIPSASLSIDRNEVRSTAFSSLGNLSGRGEVLSWSPPMLRGEVAYEGGPDYLRSLSLNLEYGDGNLDLWGKGDFLGSEVSLSGSITTRGEPLVDLIASARNLAFQPPPDLEWSGLGATFGADSRIRGSLSDLSLESLLSGRVSLGGESFDLRGEASYQRGKIRASLASTDGRVGFSGAFDGEIVEAKANAYRLDLNGILRGILPALRDGLRGTIDLAVNVKGPPKDIVADASLDGSLILGEESFALGGDISYRGGSLSASLESEDGRIVLRGFYDEGEMEADFALRDADLGALSSWMDGVGLRGRLEEGRARLTGTVKLSDLDLSLKIRSPRDEPGTLEGSGQISFESGESHLSWRADNIDLALIGPIGDFGRVEGTANLSGELRKDSGGVSLAGSVVSQSLNFGGFPMPMAGEFTVEDGVVTIKNLSLASSYSVSGTADPSADFVDLAISIEGAELEPILLLLGDESRMRGKIEGYVDVEGKLSDPRVSGELNFAEGDFTSPGLAGHASFELRGGTIDVKSLDIFKDRGVAHGEGRIGLDEGWRARDVSALLKTEGFFVSGIEVKGSVEAFLSRGEDGLAGVISLRGGEIAGQKLGDGSLYLSYRDGEFGFEADALNSHISGSAVLGPSNGYISLRRIPVPQPKGEDIECVRIEYALDPNLPTGMVLMGEAKNYDGGYLKLTLSPDESGKNRFALSLNGRKFGIMGWRLGGRFDFSGEGGEGGRISGRFRSDSLELNGRAVDDVEGELLYTPERVEVGLSSLGGYYRVSGIADLSKDGPTLDLVASLSDVDIRDLITLVEGKVPFLDPVRFAGILSGRFRMVGPLSDPLGRCNIEIDGFDFPGLGIVDLKSEAAFRGRKLSFDLLSIEQVTGGKLYGRGEVDFSSGDLKLIAFADGLDINNMGVIFDGSARFDGYLTPDGMEGWFESGDLKVSSVGMPHTRGKLAWRDNALFAENWVLGDGDSLIDGVVRFTERVLPDVDFTIVGNRATVPQVFAFLPLDPKIREQFDGQGRGYFRITGNVANLSIEGSFDLDRGRIYGTPFENMSELVRLENEIIVFAPKDRGAKNFIEGSLSMRRDDVLSGFNLRFGAVDVNANEASYLQTFSHIGGKASVSGKITGAIDDPLVSGDFRFDLLSVKGGREQLKNVNGTFSYYNGAVKFGFSDGGKAYSLVGIASFDLEGVRPEPELSIEVNLRGADLVTALRAVPLRVSDDIVGRADGVLNVGGPADDLKGHGTFTLKGVRWGIVDADSGSISFSFDKDALVFDEGSLNKKRGGISLKEGRISLREDGFFFLRFRSDGMKFGGVALVGDIDFSGAYREDVISGEVSSSHLNANLAPLGKVGFLIRYEGTELIISPLPGMALTASGKMDFENGTLFDDVAILYDRRRILDASGRIGKSEELSLRLVGEGVPNQLLASILNVYADMEGESGFSAELSGNLKDFSLSADSLNAEGTVSGVKFSARGSARLGVSISHGDLRVNGALRVDDGYIFGVKLRNLLQGISFRDGVVELSPASDDVFVKGRISVRRDDVLNSYEVEFGARNIDIRDMAFLDAFPQISGRADVRGRVSGSPDDPSVVGEFSFDGLEVKGGESPLRGKGSFGYRKERIYFSLEDDGGVYGISGDVDYGRRGPGGAPSLDIDIRFRDADLVTSLRAIPLKVSDGLRGRAYGRMEISGEIGDLWGKGEASIQNIGWGIIDIPRGNVEFSFGRGLFRVDRGRFFRYGGDADVRVGEVGLRDGRVAVSIYMKDMEIGPAKMTGEMNFRGTLKDGVLSGEVFSPSLEANEVALGDLGFRIAYSGSDLSFSPLEGQRLSLSGTLDLSGGVGFREFSLLRDGAKILMADGKFGERGKIDLRLEGRDLPMKLMSATVGLPWDIDGEGSFLATVSGSRDEFTLGVDSLKAEGKIGGVDFAAEGGGRIEFSGDSGRPTADGAFIVKEGVAFGARFHDVAQSISFRNGIINISPAGPDSKTFVEGNISTRKDDVLSALKIDFVADSIDLKDLSFLRGMPQFSGKAVVRGSITGALDDPRAEGTVKVKRLEVKDVLEPLEVEGRFSYGRGAVRFEVRDSQGKYSLAGSSEIEREEEPPALRVRVLLRGADLATSLRAVPLRANGSMVGTVSGELSIEGRTGDWRGQGNFSLEGVRWGIVRADRGDVKISFLENNLIIDSASIYKGSGRLNLSFGRVGLLDDRSISLSAYAEEYPLGFTNLTGQVDFNGDMREDKLSGNISSPRVAVGRSSLEDVGFHIRYDGSEIIYTPDPARKFSVSGRMTTGEGLAFEKMRLWRDGAAVLEVSGNMGRDGDMALNLAGDDVPASWTGAITAFPLKVDGRSAFEGILTGTPQNFALRMNVDVKEGSLEVLRFASLTGNFVVSQYSADLNLKVIGLEDYYTVRVEGFVPFRGSSGEAEMDLALTSEEGDLAVLPRFIDRIETSSGSARGKLRLRGNLDDPIISGEIDIAGGKLRFKDFPTSIEDLNADVRIADNFIEIRKLDGRLGGTEVNVRGRGQISKFHLSYINATVRGKGGNGIPVSIPGVGSGRLTGDANISGEPQALKVSGKIIVEEADISYPFSAPVGEDSPISNVEWDVDAEVRKLNFRTRESALYRIETQMGGNVHVTGSLKDRNFGLGGELRGTRGTVDYLNTSFKIRELSVRLSNIEPRTAVYSLAETDITYLENNERRKDRVYILVNGDLDNLDFKIGSQSGLSEARIVSILTLGSDYGGEILPRSAEETRERASGAISQVIGGGARAFAIAPLEQIARQVIADMTGLSLDTLRFRTTAPEVISQRILGSGDVRRLTTPELLSNTEVIVGRYLSKELYLGFGSALEETARRNLDLRYELNLEYDLKFLFIDRVLLQYEPTREDFLNFRRFSAGVESKF